MKTEQYLNELRVEAKEFEKDGGNIYLFWAGRLAIACTQVANSNAFALSTNIEWMDLVRQEYDNSIFNKLT